MQQRVAALIAASVLLIASVVGIAVRSDDDDVDSVALPSPTATAAPDDRAAKPTKAPATKAPDGTQTTSAPKATTAPGGSAIAPSTKAVQPKPGTYRFKKTEDGETSDWSIRIANKGTGKQTETFEGNQTNDVSWRSNGKYLTASSFGPGASCDWDPDIRELKLPFAKDSSWSFGSSCKPQEGFTIQFSGRNRVVGTDRVTVGGEEVDVWLLSSSAMITFTTPQGQFREKVSSEDQFAPGHGMYVRTVEKRTATDPRTGEESPEETTTRELTSLKPAS